MKKKIFSVILVLVMSVLCIGCGKDKEVEQSITNTENVVENIQQEEETVAATEEESGKTKIDDEAIVSKIKALIFDEKEFRVELNRSWPEYEDGIKIDKKQYRLVDADVAVSWADYEARAKDFYTDAYIKEEFTPYYTIETKMFVEKDGKLYRAEADGILLEILDNTIEVFQSIEERLYVTYFVDDGGEEVERALLIEKSETSPYGYVIVEKIDYVK